MAHKSQRLSLMLGSQHVETFKSGHLSGSQNMQLHPRLKVLGHHDRVSCQAYGTPGALKSRCAAQIPDPGLIIT